MCATCEYEGKQSAKPKLSEVLNMDGRHGNLKARDENTVTKTQQGPGMEDGTAPVTTGTDKTT